jgi:hypothetical protein
MRRHASHQSPDAISVGAFRADVGECTHSPCTRCPGRSRFSRIAASYFSRSARASRSARKRDRRPRRRDRTSIGWRCPMTLMDPASSSTFSGRSCRSRFGGTVIELSAMSAACPWGRDSLAFDSIRPRSESRGAFPANAGAGLDALRALTHARALERRRIGFCLSVWKLLAGGAGGMNTARGRWA